MAAWQKLVNFLGPDLTVIIVGLVAILALVQVNALFLVWLERKVAVGWLQLEGERMAQFLAHAAHLEWDRGHLVDDCGFSECFHRSPPAGVGPPPGGLS